MNEQKKKRRTKKKWEPVDWTLVDWSKSNEQLGTELRVSAAAIWLNRPASTRIVNHRGIVKPEEAAKQQTGK